MPDLTSVMKIKSLRDLLIHELKDIYYAEKQILKALPKMAKAAVHQELKAAFEEHLEQTQKHVSRLEEAFDHLQVTAKGEKCLGIEGIIAEGEKLLEEELPESVQDAALIASAQRVEHYEMAAYGSARAFAEILEEDEVVDLLSETLDEEKETDEKLTEIAESLVNNEAEAENADR